MSQSMSNEMNPSAAAAAGMYFANQNGVVSGAGGPPSQQQQQQQQQQPPQLAVPPCNIKIEPNQTYVKIEPNQNFMNSVSVVPSSQPPQSAQSMVGFGQQQTQLRHIVNSAAGHPNNVGPPHHVVEGPGDQQHKLTQQQLQHQQMLRAQQVS